MAAFTLQRFSDGLLMFVLPSDLDNDVPLFWLQAIMQNILWALTCAADAIVVYGNAETSKLRSSPDDAYHCARTNGRMRSLQGSEQFANPMQLYRFLLSKQPVCINGSFD